jgi:hypothetical protein
MTHIDWYDLPPFIPGMVIVTGDLHQADQFLLALLFVFQWMMFFVNTSLRTHTLPCPWTSHSLWGSTSGQPIPAGLSWVPVDDAFHECFSANLHFTCNPSSDHETDVATENWRLVASINVT